MQNKRGISQAFVSQSFSQALPASSQGLSSPHPKGDLQLRAAAVFDVFEISQIMAVSSAQLCQTDPGNASQHLAQWGSNMTPGDMRDWIAAGHIPTVAVDQGRIAGLGHATGQGQITRLDVAPWARGCGVGRALLNQLEADLAALGYLEAHLVAPYGALGFFQTHGWQAGEPVSTCANLQGYEMRKVLQTER